MEENKEDNPISKIEKTLYESLNEKEFFSEDIIRAFVGGESVEEFSKRYCMDIQYVQNRYMLLSKIVKDLGITLPSK